MSNVQHTASELIEAVGMTYKAIDIRSVAIRKEDSWVNLMAVVRFTYEDVDSAKARLAKLAQRFSSVKTDLVWINSFVRPFNDWSDLCSEIKLKGILRMGDVDFQLRQKPDQRPDLSQSVGYIQRGDFSRIRSFDGRAWPELTVNFDLGGVSPLMEGRLNREAHLIGYSDVLDAANSLCELNVSQRDPGCDLSVTFPVFADIVKIRARTPEKAIDVEVLRHQGFSDLRAVICVRGQTTLADSPFRAQIPLSAFHADDTKAEIVSAQGSVEIQDMDPDNDWLEIRLVHPRLGEVKTDSNYIRMFIPPSERNILLEAVVREFCRGTTLDDLLARAYNVQPAKLKPSAAFELHVSWLLGMFHLSTVILGEYERILAPDTPVQRASIDILAAHQRVKLLLIVSCTLNPPKPEDFNNLKYAREILARGVFAGTGVRVIPVLFTSSMGGLSRSEDPFDYIPVIDADDMRILLELLKSGQERRFFEFLGNPTLGLTTSSQPG
jgi:hypothetical protein